MKTKKKIESKKFEKDLLSQREQKELLGGISDTKQSDQMEHSGSKLGLWC